MGHGVYVSHPRSCTTAHSSLAGGHHGRERRLNLARLPAALQVRTGDLLQLQGCC